MKSPAAKPLHSEFGEVGQGEPGVLDDVVEPKGEDSDRGIGPIVCEPVAQAVLRRYENC